MERNTIENILNFLEEKEGKELPKKWFDSIEKLKLIKQLENHPDGTQQRHKTDLYLDNSGITKLPNDLYVSRHLNLANCKKLTKLPDELHVGGNLNLYGCEQLTELPDYLYVGFNLSIKNTPLADKYTDEEIYEMVASTGGIITDRIIR